MDHNTSLAMPLVRREQSRHASGADTSREASERALSRPRSAERSEGSLDRRSTRRGYDAGRQRRRSAVVGYGASPHWGEWGAKPSQGNSLDGVPSAASTFFLGFFFPFFSPTTTGGCRVCGPNKLRVRVFARVVVVFKILKPFKSFPAPFVTVNQWVMVFMVLVYGKYGASLR